MRGGLVMAVAVAIGGVAASVGFGDTVTGVSGGGQPFTNVQPSLGLNYMVRTTGDFDGLGEIKLFPWNVPMNGWERADGGLMTLSLNTALFAKLSTIYGGDGKSTFGLPDLQGRVAIHSGQGPGLTHRDMGEQPGIDEVTLTEGNLPPHAHTLAVPPGITGMTGGGQPFTNMQPSLAVNFGIMLQGDLSSSSFVGQVRAFAPSFLPAGMAELNGQAMLISQNQDLYNVIGTTYGGNGQTTFALPDLRGRAAMGTGVGPAREEVGLGQTMGTEEVTLTMGQMPLHEHTLPPSSDLTDPTGGADAISNLQPSLGLRYLISTAGVFPSSTGTNVGKMLGEITLFAGNSVPAGWIEADGRLLSISQNQGLFFLLGTTFGGDGVTTFGMPDLRGRLAMGFGTGFGLPEETMGQVSGVTQTVLTEAELAPHVHTIVPEPGMASLTGVLGLGMLRRRKRMAC